MPQTQGQATPKRLAATAPGGLEQRLGRARAFVAGAARVRRYAARGRRWALRALRHPRYSVSVAKTLAENPAVLSAALRSGARRALLDRLDATFPGPGGSFSLYEAGFWGQVYFFDEYEIGSLGLSGSPLVLDVGGNVGFFSWRVRDCCPGARIFAFEPEEANFARLRQSFSALGIAGEPVRAAVGDHEGSITLHLRNSFTHSIEPSMHPELASGTEEVEMVTLDGFLSARGLDGPVALVKIDVEGAEASVLAGAAKTLERTSAVVLEYHSAENLARCRELIESFGFRCRPKSYWGAGVEDEGLLLCKRR